MSIVDDAEKLIARMSRGEKAQLLQTIDIRDPFFDIAAPTTHVTIDFYVGTDEMEAGHSNVLSAFVRAHPSRNNQDVVSATLRTLLGVLHRSIATTITISGGSQPPRSPELCLSTTAGFHPLNGVVSAMH